MNNTSREDFEKDYQEYLEDESCFCCDRERPVKNNYVVFGVGVIVGIIATLILS